LLLWSRATVRTGIAGDASIFRARAMLNQTSSVPFAARPRWRRELRARRRDLPPAARRAAEAAIRAALARSPWLRPGNTVSLYVARGPEVGTDALRTLARERGCRVYLPRITDFTGQRMALFRDHGGPMRLNRFAIDEPLGSERLSPASLDVALMPLVGFDDDGNRLGNGAGYYDKLLAWRRGRRGPPLLVGIAFECQRCPPLEPMPHDVPLDAVVTERGIRFFSRRRSDRR
jgi:5-formyltetrahydrofolate cyclo-ligase